MSKLTQAEIDALFAQYGGEAQPSAAPAQAQAPAPAVAEVEPPAESVSAPVFPAFAAPPPPEPTYTPSPAKGPADIGLLANVELEVTVRLGSTHRSIREILSLGAGSVLELDSPAGEAVDILVNGRMVARGEVVVVGENYGVRITELVAPAGGQVA